MMTALAAHTAGPSNLSTTAPPTASASAADPSPAVEPVVLTEAEGAAAAAAALDAGVDMAIDLTGPTASGHPSAKRLAAATHEPRLLLGRWLWLELRWRVWARHTLLVSA